MIESISFQKLKEKLNRRHGDAEEIPIALLIGSADSGFMKKYVLNRMNDYHHASKHHLDFYFPGYGAYWNGCYGEEEIVCEVDNNKWLYSSKKFHEFIEELENETKWQFSGEVELILLNYTKGNLDFSEAIVLHLDQMVKEDVITSPASLFYKIFRKFKKPKTVHKLSDQFTLGVIGKGILSELGKHIPGSKELIKGRHYVTRNLSK